MSVLMSYPEIQYVLLRSLHAIVQKRPMLLDKDFKYFFVQYNDPIYVKLEKVDILYKLCDNKNYEVIIKEFTSYALTETNSELIHKSVKYIGCVGYKFEKSLDVCVESLSKIIENNNDEAISESIIVSRDLMRKYKGRALELINKLSIDLINSLSDQNAKSAALYILGDFCTMIPKSTEMITYFVNNFSNVEYSSKVKLQILNAGVKNFVNKPDESEEIVKLCLQKGAEESENPDIRDRAYIYWRLLEIDPDIAKDMMVSEKPPFDFTDEDDLEPDVVDDMISNMTNVSAVYLKKQKEMITEEDYINDPIAKQEREEEEKEEKKRKKEREEKEKEKKK
jgi:vesicle coat complex subunit